MRLNYDRPTIAAARAAAEEMGHQFNGRFTRVRSGLSWESHRIFCHWPVVVVPAWYPWERSEVFGAAVRMTCPVGRHA